jgi:hypothetical protein
MRLGIDSVTEWKSKASALRAYQRRTGAADALIAPTYLSGTNTRCMRRPDLGSCGRKLVAGSPPDRIARGRVLLLLPVSCAAARMQRD